MFSPLFFTKFQNICQCEKKTESNKIYRKLFSDSFPRVFCNFFSYIRRISHVRSTNVGGTSRWPRMRHGCNAMLLQQGCLHDPTERDDPPTAGGRVAAWRTTVWCPSQPPQAALFNGEWSRACDTYSSLMNFDL